MINSDNSALKVCKLTAIHFCCYEKLIPTASGWNVGDCLKEHQADLPAPCVSFINVMDECKDDINNSCNGKEYTGEVLSCLTEWTPAESLSQKCTKAIELSRPPKLEKKKSKDSDKAKERRKIRREAAKKAGVEL